MDFCVGQRAEDSKAGRRRYFISFPGLYILFCSGSLKGLLHEVDLIYDSLVPRVSRVAKEDFEK